MDEKNTDMTYDFTTEGAPRGTNSVKWDKRPDVLPMWVAEMDFPVAPFIVDAVRARVDRAVFGYTLIPDSYYECVTRWFCGRYGWAPAREEIIPVCGIVPATSIAVKALTEPGDKVVFFTPAYNCFFHNITNPGGVENRCELVWNSELSRYGVDWADFTARIADPQTKAFLLCNPHNPCGRLWSREELLRMGRICKEHGVPVISDEIHCEIVAPGTRYVPFATLFPQDCISFVSPTKPFSMPGLEIANIICANADFRARLDRVINIWEHCDVNQLGIVALQAAYTPEGADWLDQMNAVVHANYLDLRNRFADEFPQVRVAKLEATYLDWLDFAPLGLSGKQIQDHLLEHQKLWVNAGDMYGGPSCMRINLACPRSTMKKALDLYVEGIKELL